VKLWVIRHGVAEDRAPGGDDGARRLTPRGRTKMQAAARGMVGLGMRFDTLLTSPLARAAETAAIVAAAFGGTPPPRELAALAQGTPPAEMLRALRPFLRRPRVALVGHEPGLSALVALLLTGSPDGLALDLKKGGVVALELSDPRSSRAVLRAVFTPRALRRVGRATSS